MQIIVLKEGAIAANALRDKGLEFKVTDFSVFRTTRPVNQLPFPLTASTTSSILNGWIQLPNTNRKFPLEPLATETDLSGTILKDDKIRLEGRLADAGGTFSYDAVVLYLSTGEIYAIAVSSRLLNKKQSVSSVSGNMHILRFVIGLEASDTKADLTVINEKITYSYIEELSKVEDLPSLANSNRIYRVTTKQNTLGAGATVGGQFNTFLVHMGSIPSNQYVYNRNMWIPSNHSMLMGYSPGYFKATSVDTFKIYIDLANAPDSELLSKDIEYLISTFANTSEVEGLTGKCFRAKYLFSGEVLVGGIVQALFYSFQTVSFTFSDTQINVKCGVAAYAAYSDLEYVLAFKEARRSMAEIQYAEGRQYESDSPTHPNTVLKPFFGYDTVWEKLDGVANVGVSSVEGFYGTPGIKYAPKYQGRSNGSISPPYHRATNVWRRKISGGEPIGYNLSANLLSVKTGEGFIVSLTTTGLNDGSKVTWVISGVSSNMVSSPNSLNGHFTVQNGQATLAINPLWVNVPSTKTLKIYLYSNPLVFVTVDLIPISFSLEYFSDAAMNNSISSINEGSTVYAKVYIGSTSFNGSLYTSILNQATGDATTPDISGLPTSVLLTNGTGSFNFTPVADNVTEGNETLRLTLFNEASLINPVCSKSIVINDTSKTPIPTYDFYFSTSSTGDTRLGTTGVNEGSTVYAILKTTNVPIGTSFTFNMSNSGNVEGYLNLADFDEYPSGLDSSLPSNQTISRKYVIKNDQTLEGNEKIFIEVLTSGAVVIASGEVTVIDSSIEPPNYDIVTPINGPNHINLWDYFIQTRGREPNQGEDVTFIIPEGRTYVAPLGYTSCISSYNSDTSSTTKYDLTLHEGAPAVSLKGWKKSLNNSITVDIRGNAIGSIPFTHLTSISPYNYTTKNPITYADFRNKGYPDPVAAYSAALSAAGGAYWGGPYKGFFVANTTVQSRMINPIKNPAFYTEVDCNLIVRNGGNVLGGPGIQSSSTTENPTNNYVEAMFDDINVDGGDAIWIGGSNTVVSLTNYGFVAGGGGGGAGGGSLAQGLIDPSAVYALGGLGAPNYSEISPYNNFPVYIKVEQIKTWTVVPKPVYDVNLDLDILFDENLNSISTSNRAAPTLSQIRSVVDQPSFGVNSNGDTYLYVTFGGSALMPTQGQDSELGNNHIRSGNGGAPGIAGSSCTIINAVSPWIYQIPNTPGSKGNAAVYKGTNNSIVISNKTGSIYRA